MKGCVIAEACHVVHALPSVSINGGANTVAWSMKNYNHASILVSLGVTNAATTITVEECDDIVPSASTAIAFAIYKEETALGDTLGARTAVTSAGVATSANDNIFYVIEIDRDQLTEGYPYLRVCFSDPAGATYASVMAVLSGPRYAYDQSATAIT